MGQRKWKLILPDVELPFKPLMEPKNLSLRKQFGKHGLQVIVKLANIELTPEKSEYPGGVGYVEGVVEGQMVSVSFSERIQLMMAKLYLE